MTEYAIKISTYEFKLTDILLKATSGLKVDYKELIEYIKSLDNNNITALNLRSLLVTQALKLTNINNYNNLDWRFVASRLVLFGLFEDAAKTRGYENSLDYDKNYYNFLNDAVSKNLYDRQILDVYSKEEIEQISNEINPQYDYGFDYAGMNLLLSRYLIKSQGNIFELPQEMFLTTSLLLAIPEKPENRLEVAKKFYHAIGSRKISLATPIVLNLRKPNGNLSSCFIGAMDDSLDSIYYTLDQLAQISKNAGGCVDENSFIYLENKGITKIKDCSIGDKILSYNINTLKNEFNLIQDKFITEVKEDDRISMCFSNGTKLHTSKKHPILVLRNDKYIYVNASELIEGDICIKSPLNESLFDYDKKLSDKGWFIGCHLGDGSLQKKDTKSSPYRIRCSGNNKNVIDKFAKVCNELTGSNSLVSDKNKTNFWEYSCNKNSLNVIDDLIDNQLSKKTYTCFIPKYIKENNLYIPFLAGLIDSDGHIEESGLIDISITSKALIDELSSWLSFVGIDYYFREKISKGANEKVIYRLSIKCKSVIFLNLIKENLSHDIKISRLFNNKNNKNHLSYFISDKEVNQIKENKKLLKHGEICDKLSSYLPLIKNNKIGLGTLKIILEIGLINIEKYNEILQRVKVLSIMSDSSERIYYDIVVENTNNYYVGNFGSVVDHNCGVNISRVRASGSYIRGVKGASSGIMPWVKLINDTGTAVNQQGARAGAITVALDIWHLDIEEFLHCQAENGDLRKKAFDIFPQVVIPDLFMQRVELNEDWHLFDPNEVKLKFNIDLAVLHGKEFTDKYIYLESQKVDFRKKVSAKELFKTFLKTVVETGMPYVTFKDAINETNPNKHAGMIGNANLCTESFSNFRPSIVTKKELRDSDTIIKEIKAGELHTCNLVSLNLSVVDDSEIDELTAYCVRILDNTIDISSAPVPEANKHNNEYRILGVGSMGLADWLAKRKLTYANSAKSVSELYEKIAYAGVKASIELAQERGVYQKYQGSEWSKGIVFGKDKEWFANNDTFLGKEKWDSLIDLLKESGIRNGGIFAIAPNTSTSLLMGSTASILPVFSKFFIDKASNGSVPVCPPLLSGETFWYYQENKNINQEIIIETVSQIQKWTDQGISMELYLNLNNGIRAKDIYNLYMSAWKKKCKTVYYVRSIALKADESCVSCAN